MSGTRREFLRQASAVAAAGAWGRTMRWELGRDAWSRAPGDFLPEPDEATVRALALAAVEAARNAGASFADVRVSGVRQFLCSANFDRVHNQRPYMFPPSIEYAVDYGVRALVDGVWGFAGGYALATDAVVEMARVAVSRARANRPARARAVELAPVRRVENGVWATAAERDPFSVPVGDQGDLVLEALGAAERVRGMMTGGLQLQWQNTLQVFASSEGSLIVQRLVAASPASWLKGKSRDEHADNQKQVETLRYGGYGFEAVHRSDLGLVEATRRTAEAVVAGSGPPGPPPVSAEVGRYDLVLSAAATGTVLTDTIANALNLERALGYEANDAGTSFAAPPDEMLGTYQVASPLITLTANRTRPHGSNTVGWDDEGVAAGEHTLIERGIIVDYLTSRQTAPEIASYYRTRGDTVGSRGCVVGRGQERPMVRVPNLTLAPGKENLSLDDLIASTTRGFYVASTYGQTDQQLVSGQYKGIEVREIRAGKLGRAVTDFAFQFLTQPFWKKVDALGGPASVSGESTSATMRLVPLRAREVNVINTRITI